MFPSVDFSGFLIGRLRIIWSEIAQNNYLFRYLPIIISRQLTNMDQAPSQNPDQTPPPLQKTQPKENEWANLSKEELLKLLKESTEENQST